MQPDAELKLLAERNFIGSFEKLVEHQAGGSARWLGRAFAFVSGLPVSIFNGVVILETAERADVEAAAGWVGDAGIPHAAWVREAIAPEPVRWLTALGFERRPWIEPVMAIRPLAEPPASREGVSVRAVEDSDGLEEHIRHMIAGGLPEPVVRTMYQPAFAFDPDVRLFTATVDGEPMGNAIAIRTGEVSGVYAVGTRTEARRRGVGTAATWAAVDAGRTWGCPLVVLQSSEMGFPVYAAMGFTVIDRLVLLRRQ
jgi:GNAT superfamily N-acetyltransferase